MPERRAECASFPHVADETAPNGSAYGSRSAGGVQPRICHLSPMLRVVVVGLAAVIALTPVDGQIVSLRVVDSAGSPLGLTSVLIRQRVADSVETLRRITDREGRLTARLGQGAATLVVRRLGFLADSVRVAADSMRPDLLFRLVRLPQLLATQLVREAADCSLPAADVTTADETLWDEVVKGIEVRRLLRATYRYELRLHRVIMTDPQLGGSRTRTSDTVSVNDPGVRDSTVRVSDDSYTTRRGSTTNIRVFDEADLIRDSFLRFHCHGAPWRDSADGSVRIAFAPRRDVPSRGNADRVRGVVVMDGTSWQIRSVTYEYVRNQRSVGNGSVQYTTHTVDGVPVAMPSVATGELVLGGRFGIGSTRARWTIEQSYSAFVRQEGVVR
jgi:hypothetical protein